MHSIRRGLTAGGATLLLGIALAFALNAGTALAAEFTSYYYTWTPRSDASVAGATTIRARQHVGSGPAASDSSVYTVFRASNSATRFYDRNHVTWTLTRMDRNRFFRHVRLGPQPQALRIAWRWKTRNGVRYRYAYTVTAYHLYHANTVALFGDSLMETIYLDSVENPESPLLPAGYNGRLHRILQLRLGTTHGIRASTQNWSVGGIDSFGALSARHRVRNGVTGILGSSAVTPWADLLAARPAVVVINFGAVDVGRKVGIADFTRNLTTMVRQARARGIAVVLATCLAYDYPDHFMYNRNAQLEPYSDAIVSVASANGIPLADNRAAFQASIAAGRWDLFGRRDASYYPKWENGSAPGSVSYETQHHPWVAGVRLMASTIATAAVQAMGQ